MSSSEERSAPPALAPPADIDSGRANGQRRRPNPNIPTGASRYSPFPLHRRDCSQQELRADADVVLVPETPPLRPVAHHTITPHGGYPENSQSSSMEQDAIETLLFMSSPGTSGYHSNSQNSHYNLDTMNLDDTARQNVQRLEPFGGSQTRSCIPDQATNLERQAGDEIDMMLDQMSSDSEDDNDCTPTQLTRSRTDRRVVESTVRKDFLSGT
ncbi:uncharacterized protein BJX67DRAFT_367237 [Aspergillus lucknowensis]|uniref:Uncharacterized protein n=1 Tax=Aspergillus lucknowensis TaxID=176173 RepID=A0ABR4L991_9EURO